MRPICMGSVVVVLGRMNLPSVGALRLIANES